MRELVIRVPATLSEGVLDDILLLLPAGVHERCDGEHVELRARALDEPTAAAVGQALARWPHTLEERTVPDGWRERRRADWTPELIAGRLLVRPEWAPPADSELAIVLAESAAFGLGEHPTTRTCLELLLGLEPAGSFADLGCGTGILAILAAKLGWRPVSAVDARPDSVRATAANAVRNGVGVTARLGDLLADAPPHADGLAANVPAAVHAAIATRLAGRPPAVAVLSGFDTGEAAGVLEAYATVGLAVERQATSAGWVVAVLRRVPSQSASTASGGPGASRPARSTPAPSSEPSAPGRPADGAEVITGARTVGEPPASDEPLVGDGSVTVLVGLREAASGFVPAVSVRNDTRRVLTLAVGGDATPLAGDGGTATLIATDGRLELHLIGDAARAWTVTVNHVPDGDRHRFVGQMLIGRL